jgi:hypothetical protein
MTHEEAKRLADMILNAREEITERQWGAIANILKKHKRPAQPPLLDDRDPEANRVQHAQHNAAWNVLEMQRIYRKHDNCKRVPGTETNRFLDSAIEYSAWLFDIDSQLISRSAIKTIIKNKRPSVRHPRLARYPRRAPRRDL